MELAAAGVRHPPFCPLARRAATEDRILMKQMQKFPLEARGETVSREALVQAALQEITQTVTPATPLSSNRAQMAANSARVMLASGSNRPELRPLMTPSRAMVEMAVLAQ